LILAVKCNSDEIVESLLSVDASVNLVDKDGCSALYHAAREGYLNIAQMLLDSGAFVNIKDNVSCAWMHTHTHMQKNDPLLSAAVRGGNVQLLRALLQKFADVNAQDSVSWQVCHWNCVRRRAARHCIWPSTNRTPTWCWLCVTFIRIWS
jgi:ankyrin repeat-rich membrane spanning protein